MHTILPLEKNPLLREKSHALSQKDIESPRIKKLVSEMKKLLAKEEFGVALAAVQVGEPIRLFIVSGRALSRGSRNAPDEHRGKSDSPPAGESDFPDHVYINPVLQKLSRGKTEKHEGCLSVRGRWGEVPRAEKATLRYLDEQGKAQTRGASGFLAHIFQHEMDHLEGILYIDKAKEVYDDPENSSK